MLYGNVTKILKLVSSVENSVSIDESSGRLRLADFLYAEYSLEEVIYQLAKVLFCNLFLYNFV